MISYATENAINAYADVCWRRGFRARGGTKQEITAARAALVQAIEAEVAAARGPSAEDRARAAERRFAQDYLDDLTRTVKP